MNDKPQQSNPICDLLASTAGASAHAKSPFWAAFTTPDEKVYCTFVYPGTPLVCIVEDVERTLDQAAAGNSESKDIAPLLTWDGYMSAWSQQEMDDLEKKEKEKEGQ